MRSTKQMPYRFYYGLLLLMVISCNSSKPGNKNDIVEFNRDIRPILNNKCIGCHGGVKKSGNLSFILRKEATAKVKSGHFAILPGDSKNSELMNRIKSDDPEFRMPMNEEPLSPSEIAILEKWIDQGAAWQDHWAFEKPEKKDLPEVGNTAWVQNPIDKFILARLEKEGLQPSERVDKLGLIRRVSLDLTGLPPSLDEIELFIHDSSPNSYEKLVDRLLSSDRYGERWAAMWMDLARYADSKGYEKDGHREIWKYRDWLIDAFNDNLRFDEFTIQQLAGDLLENPTDKMLIATAFHRNTMNNDEGGTIDEEYRMAAVIDRVNTTWDVWQGTTFSCVQCHSHPYDPIMHEEYYEFLSFFNNTADADLPSELPTMLVYTKENEIKRKQLQKRIEELNKETSKKEALEYAKQQKDSIVGSKLPIMRELPNNDKRITQVFIKGNRLDLGEKVNSNVPELFHPIPQGQEPDRLSMAQWIVDDENPLTARVTVNRFWSQLFGKGIVETEEDFGSQGFMPTHPDLLDWLAIEFQQEMKWDIKALLKLIVTSATYRQSSHISPELLERDPSNILLARGARVRLSAEQVRDQSLFVSGLLSDKMYGKSVMPYQPEGVWQTVYSGAKWKLSDGEDAHRRAIYTYWRRTSPYPSMMSFDTPSREVCVMRRIATNTPLQALVNLNDPVYIEAANALGSWMTDQGESIDEKISRGYKRALGRSPEKDQLLILSNLYKEITKQIAEMERVEKNDIVEAKAASIKKEYSVDELRMREINLETSMSYIAHAILNLNEFMTKQ